MLFGATAITATHTRHTAVDFTAIEVSPDRHELNATNPEITAMNIAGIASTENKTINACCQEGPNYRQSPVLPD